MKKQKCLFIFLLLMLHLFAAADDGMWMPHQMKDLHLQKMGLTMNPGNLYKKDGTGLMSAVVHLGGGTGEFVSRDGLILTNHHVAFGALQRASDPEHDYITDGFIAWERSGEIPAPGYIADVLLGYEDVTKTVQKAMKKNMTLLEQYDALDKIQKKLIAGVEKKGNDLRAEVASMYGGNQYYLFRFKRLQDIRIVYAPPRDLGNFGGDIDNWMWPRHTCDFSFLRAYVSQRNEGVKYAADNVPYHPESIIRIAREGVSEGDFTFVMGYPGRTYRNYSLSQLAADMQRLQRNVGLFSGIIDFFENAGRDNKAVEIKYASRVKGLNNALKNYQGKLEGMQKVNLLSKKQAEENAFTAWVQADSRRTVKYGDVLNKLDAYIAESTASSGRNQILSQIISGYMGSAVLSQAYLITRAVTERQKPDGERESNFQERNWENLKQGIQLAERGYDLATDRAFFKDRLKAMRDLPDDMIPEALKPVFASRTAEAIEAFVDGLYDGTGAADPEVRLGWLEKSPEALEAMQDPMLKLAAEVEKALAADREKSRADGMRFLQLRKPYLAAMLEMKGNMAPDANGTLRFTAGTVEGYKPRDAVYYKPLTLLKGVIEKDTGTFPFHVPDKLKALYAAGDFGPYAPDGVGDVPACFLNTTNVTGGSSGSPTLNARGEQVGIIFDMTYESVIGDYYIIPELQRTISVDLRYVLFVTEKFSGAKHVIEELEFGE